jgi:hypothetical protein
MCLGLPAMIGAGLQIFSGAAQYMSQAAYAKTRQQLENEMSERNQKLALEASRENYNALQQRDVQLGAKAAEQIQAITREARAAQGRVGVAAAAANVKGQSVDELLQTYEQSQLEYVNKVLVNREWQRAQTESELRGVRLGLEARLVAATPDIIPKPNLWANALGTFASAFNTGISIQSAIDPTAFRSTPPTTPGYTGYTGSPDIPYNAWGMNMPPAGMGYDQFGYPISLY